MVTFYLDEDVTETLAVPLRAHGHTAITTTEAGRKGTRDYEQIWFAATQGSIVLTVNRRDFESLHGAWLLWGVARAHAGIIVLHQMAEGDLDEIAADVHTLVTHPDAFFAARIRHGEPPTRTPVAPIANRLYRRFRDGWWDCIG